MVKKKFIDKKRSTTYHLVFRSTEDADDLPERVLVAADQYGAAGPWREDAGGASSAADEAASGRRYPPGHPLSWLEEEERAAPMSEARRRELIELGFPDDGYDYLKHMRVLGRGTTTLEGVPAEAASGDVTAEEPAAAGPSMFVRAAEVQAPEEDLRVIDASRLTVMQAVDVEQDAVVMAGGVTAFSREKERERVRGTLNRELAELEAIMEELEDAEDLGDAEGDGDLLDDFVLAATDQGAATAGDEEQSSDQEEEYSVVDSEEEEEGESSDGASAAASDDFDADGNRTGSLAARSSKPPARPGSIASTYWRDERTDRKKLLNVIDERFEHLALEYDEEEIGDLEEQGDTIRGFADVKEFDGLLDEFLEVHGQSQEAREANVPYSAPRASQVRAEMEAYGFDDSDAAVAVQKAHEALRRAEAEEAAREAEEAAGEPRGERDPSPAHYQPQERERWDCESVLSLRSNLDNHPGSISEPTGSQRRRGSSDASASGAAATIRLDRRGIPRFSMPRRGLGAVPEAAEGPQSDEELDEASTAGAVPTERRKGETADEKKARKAAVKESQRHARAQKKELKATFKRAEKQAARLAATAQPQAAVKLPS